jgi:nicotinate-nucleotide pyrophosphorylase (carboxylating)
MTQDKNQFSVEELIDRALFEDLGTEGDITSLAVFGEDKKGRALIRSKDQGTLSGAYLIEPIFHAIDPSIEIKTMLQDGGKIFPGSEICLLDGPLQGICAGERLCLNFLQRLSGIATATAKLVDRIAHTKAKLLDTRKTTPLLRNLEKLAVTHGGGMNHRFGLFDMVLIKDTHVKAAGGVSQALAKVRATIDSLKKTVKIEVEVQTWDELVEALPFKPDRIMLDNMSTELMAACVTRVRSVAPGIELEASGNIDEKSIAEKAETGVDFISVGAITHSVKALDIHLVIL